MSLTRRDKNNAKLQVKAEADEMVRRYNAARAVAAHAVRLQYRNVSDTPQGEDFRLIDPNPLGKQLTAFQRGPYEGTMKANGKPL